MNFLVHLIVLDNFFQKRDFHSLNCPNEFSFTSDNIKLINELYKDDFDWLHTNGFDYKLEYLRSKSVAIDVFSAIVSIA